MYYRPSGERRTPFFQELIRCRAPGTDRRARRRVGPMAEQGKGLYDQQYGRFRENQGTHQGYEFQHGPVGSVPPPVVTFMDKIKWWTLRGWRRKKILAERDRFQQDIIRIKQTQPKS